MVRSLNQSRVKVVGSRVYLKTLARRVPGEADKYEWRPVKGTYDQVMRRTCQCVGK